MNYRKIYDSLIHRAKDRVLEGYQESHHIVPRSFGGPNDKSNLVNLTAREHFIAHVLLYKFSTGNEKYKMLHALKLLMFGRNGEYKVNSRMYETIKQKFSEYMSLTSKEWWQNEQYRESVTSQWTQERREQMSSRISEQWKDESFRESQSKKRKAAWTPERRAKHSARIKELRATRPDWNENHRTAITGPGKGAGKKRLTHP